MTDEEILRMARSLGLDRAVETDPASVIAAAARAKAAADRIKLTDGSHGEPWPPMRALT